MSENDELIARLRADPTEVYDNLHGEAADALEEAAAEIASLRERLENAERNLVSVADQGYELGVSETLAERDTARRAAVRLREALPSHEVLRGWAGEARQRAGKWTGEMEMMVQCAVKIQDALAETADDCARWEKELVPQRKEATE